VCVNEHREPCENNWNIQSCFGCGILSGTKPSARTQKFTQSPILFRASNREKLNTNIATVETIQTMKTDVELVVQQPEVRTIIPEIEPRIQHQHSDNLKWHNHDLNAGLRIEETCAYCRVPSSGIYKINTLSICLNCYMEICSICNGMFNSTIQEQTLYTLGQPK